MFSNFIIKKSSVIYIFWKMPKSIYCKRKLLKNSDEKQVYFLEKGRSKESVGWCERVFMAFMVPDILMYLAFKGLVFLKRLMF